MSMELLVEGFPFAEHHVNDRGKLLRDQRARNRFAFAPMPALELRFHFEEVLRRANRSMVKCELEIPVPIA